MTTAYHPEGDGRIQVAARNMHRGGDEGRDRQAMRQRDREGVVSRRFDRADSDKNQRKGSDEFRDTWPKFFHLSSKSKRADNDNPEPRESACVLGRAGC